MPHANLYSPTAGFSDDANRNTPGRSGVNATALDGELLRVSESINRIINNQKLLQRDDGRLGDTVVEVHTLSREVLMLLGNYRQRGVWLAQTLYTSGDVVTYDGLMYVCKISHVSDSAFIESPNWLQFGFAGSADAAQAAAQATSAASQAVSSATAAQSSATLATTKASDANASATNAATSASAAQTASTSASNSAAQATAANNAAQAAAAVAQSATQVSGISNDRIIYGDDASKTSAVASADLAVPSGFYESSNDVPSVGKWLIVNCKSQSENTVVQIALSTTDPSTQYTRRIAGGVKSAWIYKTPYETSTSNIKPNGVASVGSSPNIPRADHVHPTDTSRAPLESPALTGIPTAPTASSGDETTQLATTAFVQQELFAAAALLRGELLAALAAQTYVSPDISFSGITSLNVQHNLGTITPAVTTFLRCISPDGGFVVGDVVNLPVGLSEMDAFEGFFYIVTSPNTITFSICSAGIQAILNKAASSSFAPGSAKWKLIVKVTK